MLLSKKVLLVPTFRVWWLSIINHIRNLTRINLLRGESKYFGVFLYKHIFCEDHHYLTKNSWIKVIWWYTKSFQGKLVKITPTETLELVVYTSLVVNAINNKCVIILLIIIHHLWCIMAFTKKQKMDCFFEKKHF